MSKKREVPSGKGYWQVTDAQVQLSRSLLAGRKDTRTHHLSSEDSSAHSSSTSRLLYLSYSRQQQVDNREDVDAVRRLPDTVVVDGPRSDTIERLRKKRSKKHQNVLKQMDTELTEIAQECETQVKTLSKELLSSKQEVDLRLDSLKGKMEQMEHPEHVGVQDVHGWYDLWQQVVEEMKLKKIRVMELNHKLTETENQRTNKIRAVLKKYYQLLENISFLPPPDVHRLIHTEATMLNQSLLANRRSTARLVLLLQEETLQQESNLHLHWDDCLSHWKRSRVTEVIDRFRSLCSSNEGQELDSGLVHQMNETQRDLNGQRQDLVNKICSLVPPTCSMDLVSDWFSQLTAINQQIDSFQGDFLHQLRCCYEQKWQDQLADVERCKEELLALHLSREEVNDVISAQLLTLIRQSQCQDEEQLAALDVCCDSVARHALSLSRCVFVVLQEAALLWETHSHRLRRTEEELQQHLDDLRRAQQQGLQRKKVHLDNLLGGLHQESSEDALKKSLEETVPYLQDIKHSYRQSVSDQWEVLDRFPAAFMEELLSYSSSLSSFYYLDHTYKPDEHGLVGSLLKRTQTDERTVSADPAQPAQDWLTKAESSLMDLCDITTNVTFTSSRGVTYTGPVFQCPAPDVPHNLSLFPVELLTHTLCRTRTLFLDHLEQHFHDILSSAVAMATEMKGAVSSQQELHLQQLDPQHIQTHIYQPRLAELQLHRQRVDVHCEEVWDVLTSCRMELQELQTSISRKNQEFTVTLSTVEADVMMDKSCQRLDAVSSTLQDRLDRHIKDTQCCQTTFRQTLQSRLEEVRSTTRELLSSCRLFSEGGNFAPQEVKMFQRRLKDKTKEIAATEESIYSELEAFESESLQKVKEASDRLGEKLSFLKSEVKFTEKVQKIISSTQVIIKAEAASSNQQQSVISSRLDELRKMVENIKPSPDQVLSFLSSVSDDLRMRCQYLDFKLEGLALSAHPKSMKEVQSAPPLELLQPSRAGVDFLKDPVVDIIRSLNRVCVVQSSPAEGANTEDRGQKVSFKACQIDLSVKRGCRSIRTDKRFQIFGPKVEQNTHSFSSTVNTVLWKANDVLLQVAEDFYHSERVSRFQLVPDTLDQWTESMQQRLLGYQEQARGLLSMSRDELVAQLFVWNKLLHLPSVLMSNHEQQQGAELTEEVGGIKRTLEETLGASEKEKGAIVRELRVSLREDELQTLTSKEELRQQLQRSAICCSHLEIQECVRVRGEEFVTSLALLTEKLLHHLDNLVTPGETDGALTQQHCQDSTITMEKGTEPGEKPSTGNRTWSGITYVFPPTNSTADPSSSVTTVTTASITTARCTMGHQAVIEQRDAAVKRFEQLISSELLRSDNDKRRQLSELQSWGAHWRQQMHTLKLIHQP